MAAACLHPGIVRLPVMSDVSKAVDVVAEIPWTREITAQRSWWALPWRELLGYRDLIWLFAKRDISATYSQTVLGPWWFILQPLLATAVFSLLFGRLGRFGTDGIPHFLFYMSGLSVWNLFSECINRTAGTFTRNAHLFGKVYFPRMVMPVASLLHCLLLFAVQLALFLTGMAWYGITQPGVIAPNWHIALVPGLLVLVMLFGLGVGCIISALTTRYRDLSFALGLGLQFWMYGSAVIFPLSRIDPADRWIFELNPMVAVIEAYRFAFLGAGQVQAGQVIVAGCISLAIFLVGVLLFHRVEQRAVDHI